MSSGGAIGSIANGMTINIFVEHCIEANCEKLYENCSPGLLF
jgi:hypothetical protein